MFNKLNVESNNERVTEYFYPKTTNDFALLSVCKRAELPEVLRYWSARTQYSGNSILDRIDPMTWALKNPWEKLGFNFMLALSKRGLKTLQKRYPEQNTRPTKTSTRISFM